MSRINTNVSSLLAQRILGQQNQSLTQSLERLSTGLRINRGADDPAGLIASERLRSEQAAISAAIGNAERADQVVNIAEGGLQEISNLLVEVQSLVGQSANEAGLSDEEIVRVTRGPADGGWSSFDSALLQAVDELHRDAYISDGTWAELDARYDTKQLMDVVFTVGEYNLVSMALKTFRVPMDEGIEGFPAQ